MDAIAAIYDAVEEVEAFEHLPQVLAAAAGARSAIVERMGVDWSLKEAGYSYFSQESAAYYIRNELYRQGPWRMAALRRPNLGRLVAFEDEVPARRFIETAYFHESIRRWGDDTAHGLGGVLQVPGGFVKVCMHRGLAARPFSREEAASLQPLLVHLGRMFRLRERLSAATAHVRLTEAALHAQGDGIFVVDADARVSLMNSRAEDAVANGAAVLIQHGRIHATSMRSQNALAKAISEACSRTGGQGGAVLLDSREGEPLRALIAPFRAGHRTQALVLVGLAGPSTGQQATSCSVSMASRPPRPRWRWVWPGGFRLRTWRTAGAFPYPRSAPRSVKPWPRPAPTGSRSWSPWSRVCRGTRGAPTTRIPDGPIR